MDKFDRDMMEMMEQDANYNPQSVPEEHNYSHDQMSPSEIREFTEHAKWFKEKGFTVKVETDVKRQIKEGVNPLIIEVKKTKEEFTEAKNKGIDELKREIPGMVKKAVVDADIKGIMRKSDAHLTWETWIGRVMLFLLALLGIWLGLMILIKKTHESMGENIMIMALIGMLLFFGGIGVGKLWGNDKLF